MIRIPRWVLGTVVLIFADACGAGEQAEEQQAPPPVASRPQPAPPAQAPPPAAEPEPLGAADEPVGRLYTVQVGSFVVVDSARLWWERLSRRGLPAWTTEATVGGRTFHRLRIGASPSLAETRQLGERITREYRWPVWIAPVEDNSVIPANAIAQTHALAGGM